MAGTKKAAVEQFLKDFKNIWNGRVIPRLDKKNEKTLLKLRITPVHREFVIRELTYKDYFRGPSPDHSGASGDFWEFGTTVNRVEIYVKLKIFDLKGKKYAKCLSFHIADREIKYPF